MDKLQMPKSWEQFMSDRKTAPDITADHMKTMLANLERAKAENVSVVVPQRKPLVGKLAEVMAAVERIAKRGHNDHFNYDFVTESDITATIRSEMASRSLMLVPDVQSVSFREVNGRNGIQTIGQVLVKFTVKDGDSGEEFSFQMPGEGQDSGDKCLPKAITSALKYALLKLFMIPTGDDPEIEGGRKVSAAAQKAAQKPQDAPRREPAATIAEKAFAKTGTAPAGAQAPTDVNPYTGEEYPPCPAGAAYVWKYEFDNGWHRGWLSSAGHAQVEVKTKYDTGLLLQGAAESQRPVVYSANAKGFLSKLDWWVSPIAKALSQAMAEDVPPLTDEDIPF
jgi:hypothetical protein